MKFVKAEEGVPAAGYKIGTVRYYDEEGNVRIRFEGTKDWRCNNPGNMKYKKGGFGMRHGGIGYALSMVVFPTETVGRDALIARLKSPEFRILTIEEFPSIWDKENEVNYRKFILNKTGLSTFLMCSAGGIFSGAVPPILAMAARTSFPTAS